MSALSPARAGDLQRGGAPGPEERFLRELLLLPPELSDGLALAESSYTALDSGRYSAPNRAQGLRSEVSADGLRVRPRAATAQAPGSWELALRTRAWGRGASTCELAAPELAVEGPRAELRSGPLTEWIVNDERGIEQGWTIAERPAGCPSEPLRIELEARGLSARVASDGASVSFEDGAGATRLDYGGLRAWDADGAELEVALAEAAGGLALTVADDGARYPLTIDPWLTNPDWAYESDQANANLGISTAGAGDVNGDGYDDVIVGAYQYDAGQVDEGRAFLFLGSPAGLTPTPDWIFDSNFVGARFGAPVASAGDVNGDGYDDVVIGAGGYAGVGVDEGRVYLFLGSPAGLAPTPAWSQSSLQAGALMLRISGAGDVNADGFDDVAVGAFLYDAAFTDEGRVELFLGSGGGLSNTPAWTVTGGQEGAWFGANLASAGDVNGDGYDDLVVGAPNYEGGLSDEGRAYLFAGTPGGLSLAPLWTAEGNQEGAWFGAAVNGAGDVNGDGFDDLLVGAPAYDNGQPFGGRAFLYRGSPSGPNASPVWTAAPHPGFALFGGKLSGIGDTNADGYDDLLVAASFISRIYVYHGGPAWPAAAPSWIEAGSGSLGFFESGAGDVNADGWTDIVVGAFEYTGGQAMEGRAALYLGPLPRDCNGNGVDDETDLANGTSGDCNHNGVPDECDTASGSSPDVNGDGIPDECPCSVTPYCVGAPNSAGAGARMSFAGSPSVSANGLVLLAGGAPPNRPGIFFYGPNAIQVPFGNGFRCVGGGLSRLPVIQTDLFGDAAWLLDVTQPPTPGGQITGGSTWCFQLWYRDPAAGGANFNLSDALEVLFCD